MYPNEGTGPYWATCVSTTTVLLLSANQEDCWDLEGCETEIEVKINTSLDNFTAVFLQTEFQVTYS